MRSRLTQQARASRPTTPDIGCPMLRAALTRPSTTHSISQVRHYSFYYHFIGTRSSDQEENGVCREAAGKDCQNPTPGWNFQIQARPNNCGHGARKSNSPRQTV